jgi:hypothetical protein
MIVEDTTVGQLKADPVGMQARANIIYAPELEPEDEVPDGKTRLYSNLNKKWTIRPSLYHVKMIIKTILQKRALSLTREDHARMTKKLQKRYADLKLSAKIMKSRFEMLKMWVKRLEKLNHVRIHVDPVTGLLDATDEQIDELVRYPEFSFLKLGRYKSYLDVYELKLVLDELSKEVISENEKSKSGRRQQYSHSLKVTPRELLDTRIAERELTEVQIQYCEERLQKMGVYIMEPQCSPGKEMVLYKMPISETEQPERKPGKLSKFLRLKMSPSRACNGCLSKRRDSDLLKPSCSICLNGGTLCWYPAQTSWKQGEKHFDQPTAVVLYNRYGGRTTRSSSVPLFPHNILNPGLEMCGKARPLRINSPGDNNYNDQQRRGQYLKPGYSPLRAQDSGVFPPGTEKGHGHDSLQDDDSTHISNSQDQSRSLSVRYDHNDPEIPVERDLQKYEDCHSHKGQGFEELSPHMEPGPSGTSRADQLEYQLVPIKQALERQGHPVELPKLCMSGQELAKRKEAVHTLIVMLKQGVLEKTSFLNCCQDVLTGDLLEDYNLLSFIEDEMVVSDILKMIST